MIDATPRQAVGSQFARRIAPVVIGSWLAWATSNLSAVQVSVVERFETAGMIERIGSGVVELRTSEGEAVRIKVQNVDEDSILLEGAGIRLRFPADISVQGSFSKDHLTPGQLVQCQTTISRTKRTRGTVQSVSIVSGPAVEPGISYAQEFDADNPYVQATITGELTHVRSRSLSIQTPKPDGSGFDRVNVTVDEELVVVARSESLADVRPGDQVVSAHVVSLSTGDLAAERIEIEMSEREIDPVEAAREARYRRLSDEPVAPRDVRSQRFILHTDISERQAQILLDKLETMVDLITTYYGRGSPRIIECYVVRDLRQWPDGSLDDAGMMKIARNEGITLTRTLGGETQSVVYSCDDHGVVQHEAVHAFCSQAFGSAGPIWYAEGMAEMGQYWREGERAVQINPVIENYLQRARPKSMLDIVAAGQITGDSWQAYAWRWALCHLLANNPNYSDQFLGLGLNLMQGGGQTFESVYGPVAQEISFEYDLFVKQVGNGYRADLCAWQWNQRTVVLRPGRSIKVDIAARQGWQPAKIRVEEGSIIRFETEGEWKLNDAGPELTADGDENHAGRLVAVIFHDYELSEPIELGASGQFVAPTAGDVFLRCADEWTDLSDNSGEIEVTLERLTDNESDPR